MVTFDGDGQNAKLEASKQEVHKLMSDVFGNSVASYWSNVKKLWGHVSTTELKISGEFLSF